MPCRRLCDLSDAVLDSIPFLFDENGPVRAMKLTEPAKGLSAFMYMTE